MTETIVETVQGLRDELESILKKYHVPMDDRSFILEKIGGAVGTISSIQKGIFDEKLEELGKGLGAEREAARRDIENVKRAAIEKIVEANHKVDEAYDRGLAQGADSTQKISPGTTGVVLALFFAALAFVVVATSLFKKKEK